MKFEAVCKFCRETLSVFPNSNTEAGTETDFWCCGRRQYQFFSFLPGQRHLAWGERQWKGEEDEEYQKRITHNREVIKKHFQNQSR